VCVCVCVCQSLTFVCVSEQVLRNLYTYEKRLEKEYHANEQRPIQMKRDLFICKETYLDEKRLI